MVRWWDRRHVPGTKNHRPREQGAAVANKLRVGLSNTLPFVSLFGGEDPIICGNRLWRCFGGNLHSPLHPGLHSSPVRSGTCLHIDKPAAFYPDQVTILRITVCAVSSNNEQKCRPCQGRLLPTSWKFSAPAGFFFAVVRLCLGTPGDT